MNLRTFIVVVFALACVIFVMQFYHLQSNKQCEPQKCETPKPEKPKINPRKEIEKIPKVEKSKVVEEIPKPIIETDDFTLEEKDPSKRLKLNILAQTKFRERNGFQYLEKSFNNIANELSIINLDFQYFAYSPKINKNESKPNIQHPNFVFSELSSTYFTKEQKNAVFKVPKDDREKKILSQSLNFIQALSTHEKTVCREKDFFLYMEDDFTICEHTAIQIAGLYFWAMKHRSSFTAFRFSFS
jgi:hypothetical protein